MKAAKRKKLEAAGWKVGSADDFLGLTPEESTYIESRLALSNSLKIRRAKRKLSQVKFAGTVKPANPALRKRETLWFRLTSWLKLFSPSEPQIKRWPKQSPDSQTSPRLELPTSNR